MNKFAGKGERWGFSTLCESGLDFSPKGLTKVTFHKNPPNSELVRTKGSNIGFFPLYANQVETFPQNDSER